MRQSFTAVLRSFPSGSISAHAPLSADELRSLASALGQAVPPGLQSFLAEIGPVVLLHDGQPESSGLHVLAPQVEHGIIDVTQKSRGAYGDTFGDLVVFASTPGAGVFYLAVTPEGNVVDLFGSPWELTPERSHFPTYSGQWKVIARTLEELLVRMAANPSEPFFWFPN